MSELKQFSNHYLPQLETIMLDFLEDHCNDPLLEKAMFYSIEAGGKRFRPLLLLATVEFCGGRIVTGCLEAAAALEMMHTYSLIHDDLPAMDNDDLRRGSPTNHKVFGEGIAILAGDGLLTAAFQLLAASQLPDYMKILLLQLFSRAAGTEGMVAGQTADIANEAQSLDLAELQFIHARKTGALIEYAVSAGVILAGQEEQILEPLLQYAHRLGVAFQIHDDLLDVLGDAASLGKQVGKDAKMQKNTYPGLLGVAGAKRALISECAAAKAALQKAQSILEQSQQAILYDFLDMLVLPENNK